MFQPPSYGRFRARTIVVNVLILATGRASAFKKDRLTIINLRPTSAANQRCLADFWRS